MNRVILIGFTGKEAKHSKLPGGRHVTRLSLATTKRYKEDEQWKDKTQWHDCVVYGASADFAANIGKGAHLAIEGELAYREYERTIETSSGPVQVQWPVTEVIVHSIKPLDRSSKEDEPEEAA
ncbi:MAG TPA: single-stranded DNA-binding protein [Bryobacteraceae bacterium]|nr:single-stranded DNA-binding protein [Bryobacteraceae bacterium]